ncbi:hypothetical protein HOLleu_15246 [Holothuria leucospilota]|uniref:Uncharacterized protein n=1 Tax=Holothuria leucospilota TaxID=206669 RepID=A0A9Q1C7P8_HOLLE|nr:hypothetical protein HOLleu_15246 [Holothuria leucospilota]
MNLAKNKLTSISERAFERFESIGLILLTSVGLLEIPEKLFFNSSITVLLDLGNNQLKRIPATLFVSPSTTHTMVTLILSGNKLESIPRELLWSLPKLKQLHLFQNNLKQLPEGMLSYTSVTSVQVQNNPLEFISTDFLSGFGNQGEVTCVPDSFVTSLAVAKDIGKLLRDKGFDCKFNDYFANCTSCRVGYYGDSLLGACIPCPKGGFYQDEVGQYSKDTNIIQCKQCNNGTFVKEGGGDSPLNCKVCPEGTIKSKHANFRACFCQENHYRRERFGACKLCPNVGMNCSNDYVTLKSGYYWNWSYTDINIYKKFILNLQTFNGSYDNETVNFTEPFPMTIECSQSFKCINDNGNIEGNCAIGYSGWMCTACQDGFFPILGYCHSCPKFWVFFLEVLGIGCVCACFAVYLVYSYRREPAGEHRSIVDIALARGKILLGFYQIMGEFWNSLHTVYWSEVFKQVSDWLALLQFNISSILIKPSCFIQQLTLTPYTKFIVGISTPLLILFITAVVNLLFRGLIIRSRGTGSSGLVRNEARLRRIQDKFLSVILLILFVTYTSTCNVTFALFGPACDNFSLDENKMHNISLLRSDYSINCNTPTHRKYEIASYIASVYVVGFPAALLYLLWRNYAHNNQPNDTTLGCESGISNPTWIRFLCENYKDRFWFWEIIELVRKMSQTFVVILFGWSSSLSITVSLTLAVIFLCLHTSYSPMRNKFEHYLQLASLWAIFLNMLVAAVRVPDRLNSVYVQTAMTLMVILLNLSVVAIAVGMCSILLCKTTVQVLQGLTGEVLGSKSKVL